MGIGPFSKKKKLFFLLLLLVLFYLFRNQVAGFVWFLADKENISSFIKGFGPFAPLVFILAQIFQVVFAPFPGEATGFIGGYLFGACPGFIYSSVGLCTGSLINFIVGRWLAAGAARKMIPVKLMDRFDRLVAGNGILVIFLLFVFPGFPKDYLCIFLGLSTIPMRVFFLMATFGRMPGTLVLSLQGASLFEGEYGLMVVVAGFSILLLAGGFILNKYLTGIKKKHE